MNHAIERAKERYGLDLTEDELNAIQADIGAGRSLLLGKPSAGRERHLVNAKGLHALVIYSTNSRLIVTFLPRYSPEIGTYKKLCKKRNKAKRRRAVRRA